MNFTTLIGAATLGVVGGLGADDVTAPSTTSAPVNLPPQCCFGGDPDDCQLTGLSDVIPCAGNETTYLLDASTSSDPEGAPLSFWWVSCPGSTIDDPTSPITTLRIDTSMNCNQACGVRLFVSDGVNTSVCRIFIVVEEASGDPDLDIKPGSCPNPVEVKGGGVLPVALVGTPNFDVTQVDTATLQLVRADGIGGSVAPSKIAYEDAATPFDGELCDCHTLKGDGTQDLSLKFNKKAVVSSLQLKGEPNFSFVQLTLTGFLVNGTPFEASDCIRVQGTK